MELTKNLEATKGTLIRVLIEAWKNDSFKDELIKSPINTVERLTGEKLNLKEGIKMVVVDQTNPKTFYFNIPSKPIMDSVELSDNQLELVAGGSWESAIRTYDETGSVGRAAHSFFCE